VLTFLLADVEGSTSLWEQDMGSMAAMLAAHDAAIRVAVDRGRGRVFSTAGDSFAAAFTSARSAVEAAVEAQRGAMDAGLRVRMGLHVGEALARDGDFFGPVVNRAARLMAIGHGGQILVSSAVAELLDESVELRDLGRHRVKDVAATLHVFQVAAPGLPNDFPPLRSVGGVRSNLVTQADSFIGRETEVAVLLALVGECSLVTVTGPGGMGKTPLACHVAWGVDLGVRRWCVVRRPGRDRGRGSGR
jgi:hypothetical protein